MNAKLYVEHLITVTCGRQQGTSSMHFILRSATVTQECIVANCTNFIRQDKWPPNFPDLESFQLSYHVAVLEVSA